jgi:hypothetical protein
VHYHSNALGKPTDTMIRLGEKRNQPAIARLPCTEWERLGWEHTIQANHIPIQ